MPSSMPEEEQADLEVTLQQRAEVSETVLLVTIGGHALRPQGLQALSPHCLQPAADMVSTHVIPAMLLMGAAPLRRCCVRTGHASGKL